MISCKVLKAFKFVGESFQPGDDCNLDFADELHKFGFVTKPEGTPTTGRERNAKAFASAVVIKGKNFEPRP